MAKLYRRFNIFKKNHESAMPNLGEKEKGCSKYILIL